MTNFNSERLFFRPINLEDVTETYVGWLNDPEVNRYLEIRFERHTFDSCRLFVEETNKDPNSHLFGIFEKKTGRHIGNIKLGFINNRYSTGQLSLFIGEKKLWGKGLATESILAVTRWAFGELELARVEAGCSDENTASLRAFLNSGYTLEGYFRKNTVLDGRRTGGFWFGILSEEIDL